MDNLLVRNLRNRPTPEAGPQGAPLPKIAPAPAGDDANRVKILVVDDDAANLFALTAVLDCLGQEIVTAQSGEEALGYLLRDEFAVILLDGHMPGLDGFETAEMIRERPRSRHIPIIFVTGSFISDEMMFKGYAHGAVDYIIKPVVPGILRAKVEAFIELARIRKQLEAEIEGKIRIAAKVSKLNFELEKKNRELKTANASLEAFSYSVAHDLRAPLSHIFGYLGLVEVLQPNLSGEMAECLEKVSKSATRMAELISDMLEFARAGHAELNLQPVDLDSLIAEIREQDLHTEGRDIEWQVAKLPEVRGDRSLLRQVFSNFLSNAVKYSSQRSRAKIEIGWSGSEKERIFFVRDNGAGFDMKNAGKLFGVFQRLHSSAEFEGTGVGLSTVRSIVEKHGGRTWAEGKVGEGSVFYFSLPK
ncbi:His Kinase A (phospho-acceptor) domain-containing protein [Verrucomicrobium sp. GAS474]|uniref:sensor histidine kinase n=1 Tax=Verrucomicrobium sp. GAS474 TaxID=1882831 RepID=UPI00087BACBB|nr:ATP-binding protein [Verrucomicrobium sp. GAS474]SDT85838.1 His Kinase A (phospho-acceptor) domain-containing protein [Verrucomicrobium sp. GAS474]